VTGSGIDLDATERDGEGAILDALAEVGISASHDVHSLVQRVRRRSDGGLVVGVLGGLNLAEAETLGGLRSSGTTCVGLLVDPSTWLSLPDSERADHTATHDAAALTLLRSGWRVVGVEHGTNLAAIWPQAARGSQGFAWRAALAETVAPAGGRPR
jgi:hypothetical protein